jgi:hypothetical protein
MDTPVRGIQPAAAQSPVRPQAAAGIRALPAVARLGLRDGPEFPEIANAFVDVLVEGPS